MWPFNTILGGLSSVFNTAGAWFFKFFTTDQQMILAFFAPLINQVRDQALILGNQNLQVGFKILQDSALAAATAALTAPPGMQVGAAEAAFLQVLMAEGVGAVNNAEAATIKAAVAII